MHAYVRACVWSRDTWEALERELGARDRSKTQVLIYCTGGIRCVKVSISLLSPSSPLPSPSLPYPFLSLPFPLPPFPPPPLRGNLLATCSRIGTRDQDTATPCARAYTIAY